MALLPVLALALPLVDADPAPSATRSMAEARRLRCTALDPEAARDLRPGRIRDARARIDEADQRVVLCQETILPPDVRRASEEALLEDLEGHVGALATAAAAALEGRTWLVEVYHPSDQVSPKVSFATKNALMARGAAVSDRVPRLSAGDVDVLTRLSPWRAYPAACARYTASGSLGPDDALLALVLIDPRETRLHAGVCADGQWRWLQ